MSTHKTLTQFIVEQQQSLPDESGNLSLLPNDIATASKQFFKWLVEASLLACWAPRSQPLFRVKPQSNSISSPMTSWSMPCRGVAT